ncbi:hypothetical protein PILCRDRAFT_817373 [Piloderma croceum F 1598]|uniref:Uncharacterized protein n=1 Tax=Piloderma croceum (strain F 1598) TaxID=765440 RepID=A0A0C3G400_PILCF|nr:hypothetical protein PILCRDRAFT_817373 [Piloderma croceum F 1598]
MPVAILKLLTTTAVLVNAIGFVIADPNDWVNVNYIVQRKAATDQSTTTNAQTSIIGGASSTAMHGPWTVTNSKGVLPPSKDPHDYLSFAPYHWPDCNWCGRGTTHLANPGAGDGNSGSDSDPPDPDSPPDNSDPYPDGGDMDYAGSDKNDAEAINNTLDAMSAGDVR